MFTPKFRKNLSMPGMLSEMRNCFDRVHDPIQSRDFSLSDCLMSGLAISRSSSHPCFIRPDDAGCEDPVQADNLRTLFGVSKVPSDTRMRERLDEVDPRDLRRCFKQIQPCYSAVRCSKTGFGGHLLISVDGTGHYSSHKVKCKHCCVKNHRDGSKTYYHQVLGAAIIHPDMKAVFPLAPEPIRKEDGTKKNDCERNAAKRFLDDLRREHPHMKAVIVEDGLASNGPHIKALKEKNFRFILGAKPGDHELLFDWFWSSETRQTYEIRDSSNTVHRFTWDCNLPLNDANFTLTINMLHYEEIKENGKKQRFSWVTDLPLNRDTVMPVMRSARRRWGIENETFRTLKARDTYRFEHNFGHGNNHLSDVFATLAMLAFLIDQVQLNSCAMFQKALEKQKRILYLWNRMRTLFEVFTISNWQTLYTAMAEDIKKKPELAKMLSSGP